MNMLNNQLGCDIGGAKEPGVIYFPTNWGAKEPQNPQNQRVVKMLRKKNQMLRWFPTETSDVTPKSWLKLVCDKSS